MIPRINWLADAPDDTFGVEEEFYLVDPSTGDLADRARDIVGEADAPDLETEALQCTVESSTPACRDAEECLEILTQQRAVLVERAAALGLELHAAGVPPMLRRDEIRERFDPDHPEVQFVESVAAMAELDIFACHGIHVHVGIASWSDALTVTNAFMSQLPLLTAITANSRANAFGADAASLRTGLLLRSPMVGSTPRFDDVRDMEHATLESAPDRSGHPRPRWIIAPVPHYGTVEARAFDAHADVRVAHELALLLRALADAALRGAPLHRPSDWIERKNLRHAWSRGTHAMYLDADGVVQSIASGWGKLMSTLRNRECSHEFPALDALATVDESPRPTVVT